MSSAQEMMHITEASLILKMASTSAHGCWGDAELVLGICQCVEPMHRR